MVRVGANRKHKAFRFPLQKYSDEKALYTNFRYLQEYLRRLADSIFPPYIIAPNNSVNKNLADLVLSGDDTADEAAMIRAVSRGERYFQFLDGNITGSLMGNSFTNRPKASFKIRGMGMGATTWDVPADRHAIFAEDNTDPANGDELFTIITGISFDLSASSSSVINGPVWPWYIHECELFGSSNGHAIGDGDTDSRGGVIYGCHFRDNSSRVINRPNKTIIANNRFIDNTDDCIQLPKECEILGNHFKGASGTSIDFVDSTGDDNVIVGNRFDTGTVFANLTPGNNVIGFNWPASTTVTGITLDHISDLTNVGVNTHANVDDFLDFFNGTFMEAFDATVSESSGTVSLDLAKVGGGNLTTRFSSGLVTHTAGAIVLTTGSDTSPTENFIYILESDPTTLVKDTGDWPAAEHIKVAYLVVPSSTFVAANGPYVNQNWNDFAMNAAGQGHLSHIAERERRTHAEYFSGINGNGSQGYLTPTAGAVDLISTAGIVYQMHKHTFDAFTTVSAANKALVKNWSGDAYHDIDNLYDITKDSGNNDIGNNKYFNLVIWGVANKTGEYSPLIINLPGGFYNTASAAKSDDNGFDDFDMPNFFHTESSTGFLIARITIRMKTSGGTWDNITTTDLRGFGPLGAAGGAAALVTEFADNAFVIHDETDESKELAFDVGTNVAATTTRTVIIQNADGTMELTGHAPESHSGTGITGAELEELSDGSATTLHKHDHGGQDGLADDDHSAYPAYTEWAGYSPSYVNFTIGNGTVVARYIQIGKLVEVFWEFTLGGTSAVGTDGTVTLPVTAASDLTAVRMPHGQVLMRISAVHPGVVQLADTTKFKMRVFAAGSTYANIATITATIPGTWATNSVISAHFNYEAASAV